ncbi:carboxylate-amine ligase [Citreicella sp. C3M06]|uniref:carboxylate-amine ligase n=1 Tax=Citreicella sp. C3M06 TaxID=2841564 RepID=UPI001C092D60|nr:carboxylate-amine ligase [Citreicella sp. C3M06]MBU2962182.1 carboxylate-amine ligase [Citreicella sp. C3M06]
MPQKTRDPAFRIGIEEEYLLVNAETLALAEAPEALLDACRADLGAQVSREYLQCQVEIGTLPCANVAEARSDLQNLRRTVARHAQSFGLTPIAASCHPLADWKQQSHTDRDRYNDLRRALAAVVRRMLICGMHVHVEIDDDSLRADLMRQAVYFLPHLLALSTSSPFWQGQDTGLASYRLTVFDNLPRTGLPPHFSGWQDYERSVQTLIDLGLIEDSSKIWWDMRPSSRFPTLETRIMDVQPRIEDTLMLAALVQCILRMLWRLRRRNQRWRIYENFLVAENRWRAQRYGVTEGLIDFGAGAIVPFAQLAEELLALIGEDAEALGCTAEVQRIHSVVQNGTSASRQRAVAAPYPEGSEARMRAVVAHLVAEFHEGL